MDKKEQLINQLGAAYDVKKETESSSRFKYIADTNSLLRKTKQQREYDSNSGDFAMPETKVFDIPLEKEEYRNVLDEKKCMLMILNKGVKIGHTIKILEHENLVTTGRYVLKEVAEVIYGSESGPLNDKFCVVRLK